MSRLTVSWLIAFALVLAASAAGSQPVARFGGSFDLGFPQEGFRDNVDNDGYGGGFYIMGWVPGTPIVGRLSSDIMQYGSENRTAPWSTTIPDIFVDVSTSNNLAAGHLFLRLQPTRGFIQPYVEGLVGFHYLWTTTSVRDQGSDSEEIASTKHLSDFTFSYGVGAGLMFRVWGPSEDSDPFTLTDLANTGSSNDEPEEVGEEDEEADDGDDGKLESVGIFLDVRYIQGGEADYLREGSIEIDGGKVSYDVRHSRTDIVIVRIGISIGVM